MHVIHVHMHVSPIIQFLSQGLMSVINPPFVFIFRQKSLNSTEVFCSTLDLRKPPMTLTTTVLYFMTWIYFQKMILTFTPVLLTIRNIYRLQLTNSIISKRLTKK